MRPVDTLSSPQKPTFTGRKAQSALATDLSTIYSDDYSSYLSDTELGNSSSLFEPTPQKDPLSPSPSPGASFAASPSPSPARPTNPARHFDTGSMVREREPPGQASRSEVPVLPRPQQHAPKFGEASPLRNPLRKEAPKDPYAHLFNVPKQGQSRPEHHRVPQPGPRASQQASRPPPAVDEIGRTPSHTYRHYNAPPSQHPFARSTSGQHPFPKDTARPGTSSSTDSDLFEIPAAQFQPKPSFQPVSVQKPSNAAPRTIPPTPRALFSSIGPGTSYNPGNQSKPAFNTVNSYNPLESRKTVILDDEEDFDPDAAIRAEGNRFGAPDPYAYVDSGQAQENIKALLEGALDDDENIPRTRLRKKKKKQQKAAEKAAITLAERLAALNVKEEPEKEEEEDEDEEDGSVEGMKVKLLPHQVDGVSWMIEKEIGAHMKKVPPKGGILADDMGLGKTVQSIALILSNPRPEKDAEPENKKNKILPTVGKGTLIVAPLALIKQWEAEIKDKLLKSHEFKVLVHHGPNRTKSVDKLKGYDVVITTYQVLASEHGASGDGPDGVKKGCFGVHWYRIILDEAHTIKNRNAKMTKACYDVRAHYRWCLTGTPMQNNLDELQSLIKFLQIKPYCELSSWKDQITGPMKNGRGNLAMRRLQIFLKAFMKRRTKDVLKKDGALNFGGKAKQSGDKPGFQIVARNVENIIGSFTAKERVFYDRLANRAQARLAEMMGGEKTDYIGALVLLLRLRQACNHPNLVKSNVKDDKDALTTGSRSQSSGTQTPRKARDADADDLADLLGGLSVATKRCDVCQIHLNRDNASIGAIRCNDCEDDINASTKKVKKHKKHRKHKREHRTEKEEEQSPVPVRRRRPIIDSDDEEDSGEWLVPEDQRKVDDLGKAGGTDDENADGEADTLDSIDTASFLTEDTPSKKKEMDSFIVHDTDSEDDGPVIRKRPAKKVITLDSDDEAGSATETEGYDSESGSEETEEESDLEYGASDLEPSTKIRQLLSILEKETPDHKVIVFSQFTSMLDVIEPFLQREGYGFTRYDGSMRNDLREASLHKLRNDKRTRVLLCSLKCGSLGLNLTAASRVVIMEPFWNPASHIPILPIAQNANYIPTVCGRTSHRPRPPPQPNRRRDRLPSLHARHR